MLHPYSRLRGMTIHALDKEFGAVQDIYFEEAWAVRYLIADTGEWLPDRLVLLAPESVDHFDWEQRRLHVNLTQRQIEESPDIRTHEPLSRHYEIQMRDYFGWPVYWPLGAAEAHAAKALMEDEEESPLRSSADLIGSYLHASDGEIGHVSDLLFDPEAWAIRYLIIDTRNWWPGKKVLLAPLWIERIDWADRLVHVALTREQIKSSPEYDPTRAFDRAAETALYEHYQQSPYWP